MAILDNDEPLDRRRLQVSVYRSFLLKPVA